ncbi:hypothetical protein [Pseudonocardia sp. WMMC193]|uniref:hypothetical protein n=1 Tax=Pseudonocardia sp. WMMC193 TaxID=2911965 RepID=UPI001F3B29E3|nr:hypothetical protein [Pseudonocardia sp. WMMC193]MCF7552167.1 hypothetical protein [Pseudonocardia sp. WMMC193]
MIPPNPADPNAATAGLAREVDGLRRLVAPLPARVDTVSQLVAELGETVAALAARKPPTPVPSWLMAPTDVEVTGRLLDELAGWLAAVYLRYPDAVESFPDCWCWHPHVVEELLWLMHAWAAAYQGPAASVALAGDWHDRQRPGVVRRIKATAGVCSRENHQTRPGWPDQVTRAPTVPSEDDLDRIGRWWAEGREEPAPEPPPSPESRIGPALRGGTR